MIPEDATPGGLTHELRRVLDAYREGTTPDGDQTAALWHRLDAPIGAATAAKASLGLRMIVGGLLVVTAAVVGVIARPSASPAPPSTITAVTPAPSTTTVSEPAIVRTDPGAAVVAVAASVPSPPRSSPAATPQRRVPTPVARPEAPATVTSPSTLADELALLERARIALGRGRPSDALAIVAEHARTFPRGQMLEESLSLRIIALCDAKRLTQGRGEARTFLSTHADSALAGRIRAACELDE